MLKLKKVDDLNKDKMLISDKVSVGKNRFKYFIDYKYVDNVILLCIMLPKMSGRS